MRNFRTLFEGLLHPVVTPVRMVQLGAFCDENDGINQKLHVEVVLYKKVEVVGRDRVRRSLGVVFSVTTDGLRTAR